MRPAALARPDPADAARFAAARDLCRRRWPELFYASAFLPRAKRDAALAVVAFCQMVREAMEAPDEAGAAAGARALRERPLAATCTTCGPTGWLDARVALLAERLEELYDGRLELTAPASRSQPQHVLHAFMRTVGSFDIPRQLFLDFASGCISDSVLFRYATWTSLERHCRQTAGSVALMLAAVFGVTHSGAGEHALKLASAMRLTDILRDLKGDWGRGRFYLPLEDIARFRYSERELAGRVVNDHFRDLMRFEIARARELFKQGAEGLCWLADDGSRLTVSALATGSAGVLDAIERQGYNVFARRPALTTAQKLRRLPMAWTLARRRPGERLRNLFRPADPVHV